jgi:hypothetical protein
MICVSTLFNVLFLHEYTSSILGDPGRLRGGGKGQTEGVGMGEESPHDDYLSKSKSNNLDFRFDLEIRPSGHLLAPRQFVLSPRYYDHFKFIMQTLFFFSSPTLKNDHHNFEINQLISLLLQIEI